MPARSSGRTFHDTEPIATRGMSLVQSLLADLEPGGDPGADPVPARLHGQHAAVARDLREPGTFGNHIDPRHLEPRPILKDGPSIGERGAD